MNAKLFGTVIAVGLLAAASANAQTSTSSRRCETVNGVYTCTTVSNSADTRSTMTCQHYGPGASDCTTESKDKAPALPSVQTVTFDRGHEQAKARIRAEAGYRDPNARALDCGPGFRMTVRDGCQPR